MKAEQLYNSLKELADKLGITVSEQSFKNTGIHVNSGLCRVKDQQMFIMNKHENLSAKIEILASCLADLSLENIYIVPAVRDVLDRYKMKIQKHAGNTDSSGIEKG
ncbi:MAG: hypothetical protein C4522_14185 [Desulfobacteraceae bacterium]|nr:MAG: hypothetical protein C4522_14185 [Desulfobacteraceae bacterium]